MGGAGPPPTLLPWVVGESRGAFVPCPPSVTTWRTTSVSRPGTETRPATKSQGSGSWGQSGALHLHPTTMLPSRAGPEEDIFYVYCAWSSVQPRHLGALTPPRPHTRPRRHDLPKVPQCSARHASTPGQTHTSSGTANPIHGHVHTQMCANTPRSPASSPLWGRIPGGASPLFLAPGGRPWWR